MLIQEVFSAYPVDLSIILSWVLYAEDELCASTTGLSDTLTSHIAIVSVNVDVKKKQNNSILLQS